MSENKGKKNYPKTVVAVLEDEGTVCIMSSKNSVSFLPTYSLEEGDAVPMKKIKSDLKKRGFVLDETAEGAESLPGIQVFKMRKG